MVSQSGALLTTGASALVGMREDLGDTVSRMDPGSTPAVSWFSSAEATNSIAHDWLTIDLRAPRRLPTTEGNVATNAAPKRATRLTNTCEIFYEAYGISGTTMAVDAANALGQLVEQRLLKGLELRRDLEIAVLGPQVKVITDPREMSGVQTYAGFSSVGAGGTAPNGLGTVAVVYGVVSQALSATLLDDVMQQGWQFGARYSLYMMSSAQKRNFDLVIPVENLTENQVDVTNEDGVNVISTVAIWKSTFGQIKFIMDPVLDQFPAEWAERHITGYDERQEYRPKICWLPGRGWGVEALAKVGDTDQEQIVGECTLEVPNPKAIMLVAGLSEVYAS